MCRGASASHPDQLWEEKKGHVALGPPVPCWVPGPRRFPGRSVESFCREISPLPSFSHSSFASRGSLYKDVHAPTSVISCLSEWSVMLVPTCFVSLHCLIPSILDSRKDTECRGSSLVYSSFILSFTAVFMHMQVLLTKGGCMLCLWSLGDGRRRSKGMWRVQR